MEAKWINFMVEGTTDQIFIEKIISPILLKAGHAVNVVTYSQMSKEYLSKILHSIDLIDSAVCTVLADNDERDNVKLSRALTEKRFGIHIKKLYIVVEEIEAWYMAGLTEVTRRAMGIRHKGLTDFITKERFNSSRPRGIKRMDFMLEITKHFDIDSARKNNRSFNYFWHFFMMDQLR